jgi:hypothetical protein
VWGVNWQSQKQRWIKCERAEQFPVLQIISVDEFGNILKQWHGEHLISRQNLKWRKSYFSTSWAFLFWIIYCVCLSNAENILLMMDDLVSMEHLWNDMNGGKPKCLEANYIEVSLCPPQSPHGLAWDQTWVSVVGGHCLTAWPMAWSSPLLGRNYNICILYLQVTDVIQKAERVPQTQTTQWRRHIPSIRQETRFDIWQNEYWASEGKRISHCVFCRKQRCGDKFQMPSLQCGVTY